MSRRRITTLVIACLLAVAAFVAYHFYLRWLMLETGLRLGAARPSDKVYRIVPLYIHWRPRVKTGLLIAVAIVGGFIWWLRRSLGAGDRARFVAALMIWHVAIVVAVALIDGGPQTLWRPYELHRSSDYIGAVDHIESPLTFLRDYPRLMPELPLHCRTHPPGAPLLLWLVAQLFGPSAIAASIATIVVASLASPAVYLLARDVLDEGPARLSAGLFLLAPNVVSYTATCLDAVFMVPLLWSFFFLWHGRTVRPVLCGIAGGLSATIAAMMTFSTSFIAAWTMVVVSVTALLERRRLKATLLTLLAAVMTSTIFFLLVYEWSGYDPLAVLRQAFAGQAEAMEGRGHSSLRQSAHFAVANLVAFLFCSGLPVAWLWLCQTRREMRPATASRSRCMLLSFCLTLIVVSIAPLYTLETERIWIFLAGFLTIGAATRVDVEEGLGNTLPLVTATLLMQATQTIGMEVLLDWVW